MGYSRYATSTQSLKFVLFCTVCTILHTYSVKMNHCGR